MRLRIAVARHFEGRERALELCQVVSRKFDVRGAKGARRVDGLIDLEEGLGEPPDWTERFTVVVAAATRELVLLTVRRRPEADLAGAVEDVVASFELFRR